MEYKYIIVKDEIYWCNTLTEIAYAKRIMRNNFVASTSLYRCNTNPNTIIECFKSNNIIPNTKVIGKLDSTSS